MVDDVSAVVPTVGRPELHRALRSIASQTLRPREVVVVDDSPAGTTGVPTCDGVEVLVLRTGGVGAAEARNRGMAATRSSLVALLDDDDEWLPHHLERAVAFLDRRPDVDVYACAARVRHGSGERVEPTVVYRGRGSLQRFYYGRTAWARRRRRVMTPTLVLRRAAAEHRMDPALSAMEDLWWLFQLELWGHRLHQSSHVGVLVHADTAREATRQDLPTTLTWADRLDGLDAGTGASFLIGTRARALARAGDAEGLAELATRIRGRSLPLDLRIVLRVLELLGRRRASALSGRVKGTRAGGTPP